MHRLAAMVLAGALALMGASSAFAQTPQADACYGLTLQYQANPNPDLVRIAQDVGCIVVPAPYGVPYGAYSASPTYVQTVAVPVPYVAPVAVPYVVPVRGPNHWHHNNHWR